ncbi:glycoside hydrolase [Paenibacillus gansuensis]|uniref:Glycoside hydrolase n=1 Tax=Paenibacillus gansuensis TaxID=306542 RepID=A0ABW5P8G3_9BACL
MRGHELNIDDEQIGTGIHQVQYQRIGNDYQWDYVKSPHCTNRHMHISDTADAWAKVRFAGHEISLHGVLGPDCGIASVCIDGRQEELVDYYSTEISGESLIYRSRELAEGLHEIMIRVTGTKHPSSGGTAVTIDRFAVRMAAPCSVIDISSSTAGTGMNELNYNPDHWGQEECDDSYGGDVLLSGHVGAEISFAFTGIQVQLYGRTGPDQGIMLISVDDGPPLTVDCRSETTRGNVLLYTSEPLPQAEHRLIASVTGETSGTGRSIAIDRVAVSSAAAMVTQIFIATARRFQAIESFGASSGWSIDPIGEHWQEEHKSRIADLLYSQDKGIGLSGFRFYIGAGSTIVDAEDFHDPFRRVEVFQEEANGPYDWTRQAGQQWMMQAAKARGVREFTAFTHSPPYWMTKNGRTRPAAGPDTTNLKEGYERPYARFLADVLEHFRDEENLPFDYICPINEPGWPWDNAHEEGNRSSNDDMIRIINALYDELQDRHLPVRIAAPEAATIGHLTDLGYLDELYGNEEVRAKLSQMICGHSYFSDNFEKEAVPLRRRTRKALDAYPDHAYWQTEYCFIGRGNGQTRDYGMTPALWLAKLVHLDLTILHSAAWHWWLSVSPGNFDFKDGLLYTDWIQPGDPENIIESKMLWALGNFSKFIRPGSRRVALTGPEHSTGFLASAYIDETNQSVIAVAVNDTCNERPLLLHVAGMQIASITAYITSDEPDCNLKPVLCAQGEPFTVPPLSVVTLVMKY